ncbi:hypothetical protein Q5741_13810 [Paenibacillus sp. JX-17]|uniref:Uncharacterized protein n=1 Tax=Paenibacillus lacisoli TaxID=3064525 RepID=A0ABT9CHT0_9BACL|nr:hypothetical protein [Paenibacillus sp. JX-17]MDO7907482.1 hypothetical protein [Paenibacillus sp. JX-17]
MFAFFSIIINIFVLIIGVKVGIDYSKNTKHSEEMLQELREIKEELRRNSST